MGMRVEQRSGPQAILLAFCNAKSERGMYRRRPTFASSSWGHFESDGTFSTAKMGSVGALVSIRRQNNNRETEGCSQVWRRPEPIIERKQEMALKRMVPRRP